MAAYDLTSASVWQFRWHWNPRAWRLEWWRPEGNLSRFVFIGPLLIARYPQRIKASPHV